MKKVGVIGATGYAGVELLRLLSAHPEVEIAAISSVSFAGQTLKSVYPAMQDVVSCVLEDDQAVIEQCDLVFASLPHGLSEPLARACHQQGNLFIDLGADFRLHAEADYQQWYGDSFQDQTLHQDAVYGLPELFRKEIRAARLIANPGCYPTAVSLGLAPLLQRQLIDPTTIIIDAKSGVTGAGRNLTPHTHFPECHENLTPYQIGTHRHTPEIEQTLSSLYQDTVTVTFVPHLIPINRGILITSYLTPTQPLSLEAVDQLYQDYAQQEFFIRLKPLGTVAALKEVRYSNFCAISLHFDPRTNRLIVISVIDNMIKGAAGQAIQNMNLVFDFPETMGLNMIPPSF